MAASYYKKCVYCGKKVKSSAKFCSICGKENPFQEIREVKEVIEETIEDSMSYCSNCNEIVFPGAKFCRKCGVAVANKKIDNLVSQDNSSTNKQLENEFEEKEELKINKAMDTLEKEKVYEELKAQEAPQIKDLSIEEIEANNGYKVTKKIATKKQAKSKKYNTTIKSTSKYIKAIPAVLVLLVVFISLGIFLNKDKPTNPPYTTSSKSSLPSKSFSSKDKTPTPWTSGTKAIAVSPIGGVKITAEKNAMDKDRNFKVSKIEDTKLYDLFLDGDVSYFPITGFDFDSGMSVDDIFPGYMDISFDLKKLTIPENLWEQVSIIRIDDNGDRTMLLTSLKNGELICSSRKNCLFVLAIPAFSAEGVFTITALSTLGPAAIKSYNDIYRKFNYLGDAYLKDTFLSYDIYWPITMLSPNPGEVERANSELEKLNQKYGINYKDIKSSNPYDHAAKLSSLYSDETYKNLKGKINSVEWKKENYWPARVTLAVEALEKADKYLRDERNLKMPKGFIDILMLDKWPAEYSQNALAMHDGNFGQKGFISVNLTDLSMLGYVKETIMRNNKTYDVDVKFNVQDKIDTMNMNMVHELFHAVQEEYIVKRSDSYLWFWEATALTLEYEANKYYVANKLNVKEDHSVERTSWETFKNKLDDNSDDENLRRNHGYTASNLLEFLRDNKEFNQRGAKDYLKNVLESFSKFGSDTISAIYDGAGSSSDDLSSKFYAFATNKAEEMYKHISAKINNEGNVGLLEGILNPLDENNPLYTWDIKSKPLSVEYKILSTKSMSQEAMKNSSVFIIPDSKFNYSNLNIYHNIRTGSGSWINAESQIKSYKSDTIKALEIQRIDSNTATEDIPENLNLRILLMLQPKAPKAQIKGNILNVEIEKSKLIEILNKQAIETAYNIYIKVPGKDEPFLYKIEKGKQTSEIDIGDKTELGKSITKAITAKEKNIEVVYREVVKFADQEKSIAGPESKSMLIEINKSSVSDDDLVKNSWVKTETNSDGKIYLNQKIKVEKYPENSKYDYYVVCYFNETTESGEYKQTMKRYEGKTSLVNESTHTVDIFSEDGSQGYITLNRVNRNKMTLGYFDYDSVKKGIITEKHLGYFDVYIERDIN